MPEFGNVILSRRVDEGFWIGNAHVKVHEIKGGKIRVRISADKRVAVKRDEHLAEDVEAVEAYRQAPQWFQLQTSWAILGAGVVWENVGQAQAELVDLAQVVETTNASASPTTVQGRARVVDALTGAVVYPYPEEAKS